METLDIQTLEVSESVGTTPVHWHKSTTSLNSSFYLSVDYADILRRDGCIPIFYSLECSGNLIGIALGALTGTWHRWPSRNLKTGFKWNTHPCVKDNDQATLDTFVELILHRVNNHRPLEITLNSEDALISPSISATHEMISTERLEFRIDLTGGPEQVLSAMQRRKREKLRAELRGSIVTVRETNTKNDLLRLIEFQHSSRDRRRARGEDYSIASESAAQEIYDNYIGSGHARLFMASDEQGPVSGILLHTDGKKAYYTMAGCSARGFEVNAQTINVWRAIETLHKDGYTVLNMGGVKADAVAPDNVGHGLYRFKKSFGGVETRCTSWHKTTNGIFERIGRAFFGY